MSARSFRRQSRRDARRRSRRAALIAGAVTGSAAIAAPAAGAATFTVTDTGDAGPGTLRQAVADANANAGADTIDASGVSGTITLTSGQLAVTGGLEIDGPGAGALTVSGGGSSRVLDFGSVGEDLTVTGMTITGGAAPSSEDGGGIDFDGTNLRLDDVTLTGNAAPGDGGGLAADAANRIEIVGSTLSGNTAGADGGGARLEGDKAGVLRSQFDGNEAAGAAGGLEADGRIVSVTYSSFTDNAASGVGGLDLDAYAYAFDSGTAIATDLTITGNDGGGAVIAAAAPDAPALFGEARDLTITGNSATGAVGGLELRGVPLSRSTIADNTSVANTGGLSLYAASMRTSTVSANTGTVGGIEAEAQITGDATDVHREVQIVSSTVSDNEARAYLGSGGSGGGIAATGELIGLVETTVAGNRAEVGGGGIAAQIPTTRGSRDDVDDAIDLDSTITPTTTRAGRRRLLAAAGAAGVSFAGAASLIENPGSAPLSGTGNVVGSDPQLAPLADNGGPTLTRLIAPTSPAVDAGAANGLTSDQRGLPRSVGAGPDIGSVELQEVRPRDESVDASVSAKRRQAQRGKRVRVVLRVSAAEAVAVSAGGDVSVGRRKLPLRAVDSEVPAGGSKRLTLRLRGKRADRKVLRTLRGRGKRGKRAVTAAVRVELSDGAGNSTAEERSIRIKGRQRAA
ncbi:MAG: choice-of-anchor Q domain-containing protein [Solirubrobacterales bacterium]